MASRVLGETIDSEEKTPVFPRDLVGGVAGGVRLSSGRLLSQESLGWLSAFLIEIHS